MRTTKLKEAFDKIDTAFHGRKVIGGRGETTFIAVASDGETLISIGVRDNGRFIRGDFDERLARATEPLSILRSLPEG
jgi:hypothetical protein